MKTDMIQIAHITMYVANLEGAKKFFTEFFGTTSNEHMKYSQSLEKRY